MTAELQAMIERLPGVYFFYTQHDDLVYTERGIYRGLGFCARKTPVDQLLKYISYRADNKDACRILMRYLISR